MNKLKKWNQSIRAKWAQEKMKVQRIEELLEMNKSKLKLLAIHSGIVCFKMA